MGGMEKNSQLLYQPESRNLSLNVDGEDISVNTLKTLTAIKEGYQDIFSNGGGGAGKTTSAVQTYKTLEIQPSETLMLAPTAKAVDVAKEAGFPVATTIHKYIGWMTSKSLGAYKGNLKLMYNTDFDELINGIATSDLRVRIENGLANVKFILIDEISMIPDGMFVALWKILKAYAPNAIIVWSGDFHQLPPVLAISSVNIVANLLMTKQMAMVNFDERFRSIQPRMNRLIESIRDGKLQKMNYFNAACDYLSEFKRITHIDKNNIEDYLEYTYITYTNTAADNFNSLILATIPGEKETIYSEKIIYEGVDAKKKLEIKDAFQFDDIVDLKIGMQLRFTSNDPQQQFVNGEHGILKEIEYDEEGEIEFLYIKKIKKNPADEITLKVGRKTFESTVQDKMDGYNIVYTQFPVKQGNAMTIHNSQGSGYYKMILDLDSIMSMRQDTSRYNLFYTAISRIIDADHLVIKSIYNIFSEPESFDVAERNRSYLWNRIFKNADYNELSLNIFEDKNMGMKKLSIIDEDVDEENTALFDIVSVMPGLAKPDKRARFEYLTSLMK